MITAAPRRSGPGRGLRWGLLGVVVLLLLAGGGYAAWRYRPDASGQMQAQRPPPVPVQVAEAETKDVPIYLMGLGSVQAANTVTVRSRVDGQIEKIAFQEGQMVKEGDLLVQIDPRPFQAALGQAVAKKAQDEAQRTSALADLERTMQLVGRAFATQQQLDQQRATVGSLSAQIDADQAAIDNAQTQLSYTTIRSPLTGRTGFRLVDQGNIVHATDQNGIVEITQMEPIAVVFTAPESQLPGINKALASGPMEVRALSSNGKETLAEGTLALVNNQVDVSSGTIRLKAMFDNKEHKLWPGLAVDMRLLLETQKGVVSAPDTAVQRGPQGLFAYVVKADGTVEMRPLKVGPITGGQAVIADGLKAGETVVTSGHYRLEPGARVTIRNEQGQRTAERTAESE